MIGHFIRKGGWVALILVAVAGVLAAFWQADRATAQALADHGVVASATVEGRHTDRRTHYSKHGSRTETDYLVTYAFDTVAPDGTRSARRVEHEVPRWVYDDLSTGQRVDILYLPEDPASADFFPDETARETRLLGWFALGSLAVALAFAGFSLRAAFRALRLDRAGLRATGTVESVRRSKGNTTFTLRFADRWGKEHRITAPAVRDTLWPGTETGATLPLVYDPDDPSNVTLDAPAASARLQGRPQTS